MDSGLSLLALSDEYSSARYIVVKAFDVHPWMYPLTNLVGTGPALASELTFNPSRVGETTLALTTGFTGG